MNDAPHVPVLVTGAGPVGLTAALMLARHGVPVRIIDRDEGPTDLSKALVLWQRTMETVGPILPHERFSADHPILHGVVISVGDGRTVEIPVPSRDDGPPACVLIPQSATERVLLDRLQERGVTVERETELTGVEGNDDGVTCEITDPAGTTRLGVSWLVACDGAHSTVRHALSAKFPGETVSRRYMLADFDVDAAGFDEHRMRMGLADGAVALFPMGSERWRLIADLGAGTHEGEARKFTLEEVQEVLDRRTDLGWRITSSHWTSDFGVNERQVEQYVHGRILLAGDAAHVHSPAGGQGMNTGMQDAANLAWKVALVERGIAPSRLLATYHDERHPVGAAVLRQSGAMLRVSMAEGLAGFARDHLAPAALSIPALRERLVAFLTEEAVSYRFGPLADGSGHRHGVRSGDVWPLSSGAEAELVLLGGAADDEAPDRFGGPHGFPLTVTRAVTDERLAGAIGSDAGAVLVRPDGVVASVGAHAEDATDWISSKL
jgi:2-polyprenyl-6-methoxyphenol hydroxylase-like FAD-dependent oxidoreductase